LDFDALFKSVWDYTPRPTATGAARIERAIRSMLTYGDAATISALAKLTVDNIDVVIAKLIERGYMRSKTGAVAPGAPPSPGGGTGGGKSSAQPGGSTGYNDGALSDGEPQTAYA
jgi:hypothetical protein